MGHSFSLKTLKFVLNSLFFFSRDFETFKKFLVDCRKIWGKIVKNEKWQGWQGEGGGDMLHIRHSKGKRINNFRWNPTWQEGVNKVYFSRDV